LENSKEKKRLGKGHDDALMSQRTSRGKGRCGAGRGPWAYPYLNVIFSPKTLLLKGFLNGAKKHVWMPVFLVLTTFLFFMRTRQMIELEAML
jgi:hypothetical protein